MKILTFKQFTDLPDGVVYSEYQPTICRGLYKRGSVIRNDAGEAIDFAEADLLAGPGCPPPDEASNYIVVDTELYGRWGLFEFDALFAVYEPDDLLAIQSAMADGIGIPIGVGTDFGFIE